jgi:hypothetical protein
MQYSRFAGLSIHEKVGLAVGTFFIGAVLTMGAVMGYRKYQTRKASGISGEKAAKSDKTWLTPKRNHDVV